MKKRIDLSQFSGCDVYFSLPFWFADCGKGDDPDNTAVASILRLKNAKEVCLNHQCWVKVEFVCAPALLSKKINLWKHKLNRFLLRWHKTLPKS